MKPIDPYNPKEFRRDRGGRDRHEPDRTLDILISHSGSKDKSTPKNALRNVIILQSICLGVVFGVIFIVFYWQLKQPINGVTSTPILTQLPVSRSPPHAASICSPLPGVGVASILDPSLMQKTGVSFGVLAVKNDQPVTVVAVLMDLVTSHKLQALTIKSGGSAQINVPSGQYGFGILTGRDWCNFDVGFFGGTKHLITGGVTIKAEATTQAIIGASATLGQISIMYRNLYNTEEMQHGGLEVRQSQQGYVTSGSVNGIPVSFMIDTGASHVSLSTELALQAGIRCYQQNKSSTANGFVVGCSGTAAEITLGPFYLTNVEVNIAPNLTSGALIGMDVLRRFNMVWRDDMVKITAIN